MTYTKEQLVAAMKKYYSEVNERPADFEPNFKEEDAEKCVEHLLSLVDE